MNRFQYDNIDPNVTPQDRERVLKKSSGINSAMSGKRRAAKQQRHKENQAARRVSFWDRAK